MKEGNRQYTEHTPDTNPNKRVDEVVGEKVDNSSKSALFG